MEQTRRLHARGQQCETRDASSERSSSILESGKQRGELIQPRACGWDRFISEGELGDPGLDYAGSWILRFRV